MNYRVTVIIPALLACTLSLRSADSVPDHAGHKPASGLKKELIADITEADFLKLGSVPKTVRITLVSALTANNGGMNFNGYAKGTAAYVIPLGWKVEVTFINPSPVPHSVLVVEREKIRKPQLGEPAFPGAGVPNAALGISMKKVNFTFTASQVGEYAFACGFPIHALNGHWAALEISAEAKVPSVKLGDDAPREAH